MEIEKPVTPTPTPGIKIVSLREEAMEIEKPVTPTPTPNVVKCFVDSPLVKLCEKVGIVKPTFIVGYENWHDVWSSEPATDFGYYNGCDVWVANCEIEDGYEPPLLTDPEYENCQYITGVVSETEVIYYDFDLDVWANHPEMVLGYEPLIDFSDEIAYDIWRAIWH